MEMSFLMVSRDNKSRRWLQYMLEFEQKYPAFMVPRVSEFLFMSARIAATRLQHKGLSERFLAMEKKTSQDCPKSSLLTNFDLEDGFDESWNECKRTMTEKDESPSENLFLLPVRLLLGLLHKNSQNKPLASPFIYSILKFDPAFGGIPSETAVRDDNLNLISQTQPNPREIQNFSDRIFGNSEPTQFYEWEPWLNTVSAWVNSEDHGTVKLENAKKIIQRLRECRVLQYEHLIRHGSVFPFRDLDMELSLELGQHIYHLTASMDDASFRAVDMCRAKISLGHCLIRQCEPTHYARVTDQMLFTVFHLLGPVITWGLTCGRTWFAREALQMRHLLTYCRYTHFKSVPAMAALLLWQEYNLVLYQIREEESYSRSGHELLTEFVESERAGLESHYKIGVMYAYTLWESYWKEISKRHEKGPMHKRTWFLAVQQLEDLEHALFNQVQESKARTLVNLMGGGAILPASLSIPAKQNTKSREMLEREEMLLLQLSKSDSLSEGLSLRKDLDNLRYDMLNEPLLKAIQLIRLGKPVNWYDVKQMGKDFGPNVVFVDWAHVVTAPDWDLLQVVFVDGKLRSVTPMKLKLKEIETWVSGQLDETVPLSLGTSQAELRYLAPLVKPLASCTNPGQVLVFSPTKALHRLPFHALRLDGKVLIERNPIVYCQSLSLLRLCNMATQRESGPRGTSTALSPTARDEAALEQVHQIADLIHADNIPPEDMTKEKVKEVLRKSSLVHFHGHGYFEQKNPPMQCLGLKQEEDTLSSSSEDFLTANDILDTRFQYQPVHVTLMACLSARSVITGADDHNGLITAFHFAGASSVISTLWKVWDKDALEFSRVFYEEFQASKRTPRTDNKSNLVDLAIATQQAVLAIRRKRKRPYHWAGLCCTGLGSFLRLE